MEKPKNIPTHIAIIMDGNGRWAKERGLPRFQGHQKGAESIREIVRAAIDLHVPYLTLYAFSRENWSRPKPEIDFLMTLLVDYLDSEIQEMKKMGVKFQTLGKIDELPQAVQKKIKDTVKETANNKSLILNLALSYSSRGEIVDAVRKICEKVKTGELMSRNIDETLFSDHLYTKGIPDPDLLIRTSGEFRLSNFLLWQISYTELYITEKYWPDFRRDDFFKAVEDYARRERRFGRAESVTQVGL